MIQKKIGPSVLILWFCTLLLVSLVPLLRPDGGINLDSLIYFDMARNLPNVDTNIYPIGYPFILRVFNFIFNDYYWTSKILSSLCILGIGIFSIRKQFFVKATLVLLSFKVFTMIYYYTLSETVFLFVLYLLIYYIYAFFNSNLSTKKFVIYGSLLFFTLYTLRYNTVFIGLGLGVFYLIYSYQKDRFKTFFKDGFFYFLLTSLLLSLTYIIISLNHFQSMFGEDLRSAPIYKDLGLFTILNIIGTINIINPIYSIKFEQLYGSRIIVQGIITAIDAFFLLLGLKIIFKNKKYLQNPFWKCLLVISIVFFVCVFATEYLNNIDPIYTRVVIVSAMFLMFMILSIVEKEYPHKFKYAIVLGFVSVIFNFVFAVRKPVNFLAYKAKATKVLPTKPNAIYFYDDSDTLIPTIYSLPFTNKSVSYTHIYYQPGYIHKYILMLEKPLIKEIEKIDNIDSSLIIFNSEIK